MGCQRKFGNVQDSVESYNTNLNLYTSVTFSVQICGKNGNKNHESGRGFCFLILLQEKQDNGINIEYRTLNIEFP